MTKCGPAIQLCKAGESVCKWVFLIFQIIADLWLAVNQLEKSIFVGI